MGVVSRRFVCRTEHAAVNLLDRYIFKSVLGSCLAAVALFAFVLMLGNAIRDLLGYVLSGQLPLLNFGELLLLLIPFVASFALPMGILTGVLLTLGRLSADSEITAMRAAGMSLRRVARPILILGALGALADLYVNFQALPYARVRYHQELAKVIEANPLGFIVPRTFIREFPGFIVYVGQKDGPVLSDFWLWELDDQQRVTRVVRAESGRFTFDREDNALLLTLLHAQMASRNAANPEDFSAPPLIGTFGKTEQVRLSLDNLFGSSGFHRKMKWMTYAQLKAEEARLAAGAVPPAQAAEHARDVMKVKLTIQDKLQGALVVFAFALIGVPLGIRVSRRETSANLGVAIVIALGYYLLTVIVNGLEKHPELRPDLLYWLPNLLVVALAVWLFRRTERR
jgi:lipopolysaccharide export system permease protein